VELDKLFNSGLEKGTDIRAIHSGYISISLLRFEVDHHEDVLMITECLKEIESDFLGNKTGHKK
jgi:broad specificity polyphosphatase/5'/3'-nucleotidase SurE